MYRIGQELDHQDLLDASNEPAALEEDLDAKTSALGVEVGAGRENDITNLQNVKTRAEIRAVNKLVNIPFVKTLIL